MIEFSLLTQLDVIFGAISKSRCSSPARMCHVTPRTCAQDRPLGRDSVLLPFDFTKKEEIKEKCWNEVCDSCFDCCIRVQQQQRKRHRSVRLEMYPFQHIRGSFSTSSLHLLLLVHAVSTMIFNLRVIASSVELSMCWPL